MAEALLPLIFPLPDEAQNGIYKVCSEQLRLPRHYVVKLAERNIATRKMKVLYYT